MGEYFPDAVPLIGEQELAEMWANNPRGSLVTIKVRISLLTPSPLSSPLAPCVPSEEFAASIWLSAHLSCFPDQIDSPGGTVPLQRLWSHHRGCSALAGPVLRPGTELWARRCSSSRPLAERMQSRSHGRTERVREKARRREVVCCAHQIHRNETRGSCRHL